MESNSLCSSASTILPSIPSSSTRSISYSKLGLGLGLGRPRKTIGKVLLSRRDSYEWHYRASQLVDENMIVLRKRIHETKMVERNYEPPADWMEWEKQLYTSYDEMICNGVGLLQSYLMSCRPSFCLGLLVVIALSVPTSTAMVLFRVMEVANGAADFLKF